MIAGLAQELRSLFAAPVGRKRAARMEAAAGRRTGDIDGLARRHDAPPGALELRIGDRNRRQQCLCIGMDRPLVDGVARRDLDDPPAYMIATR